MEMRAGLIIAGDLFDCVPLTDGRVAVAIGDVAGHGAGSGMVMAAVQAHLHAEIAATGDPALAVRGANRYLAGRGHSEHFVTLWLGVFSPEGELLVVDAGHGYWAIKPAGGAAATPRAVGAIPVGIEAGTDYRDERYTLDPGDRVVLYSDGMVEQRGETGARFGRQALLDAVSGDSPESDVRSAFDAVIRFCGGAALTDDATAASVEYRGAARG
jgi:serine phosphatase RsbU (regulator of sigma subunit)